MIRTRPASFAAVRGCSALPSVYGASPKQRVHRGNFVLAALDQGEL